MTKVFGEVKLVLKSFEANDAQVLEMTRACLVLARFGAKLTVGAGDAKVPLEITPHNSGTMGDVIGALLKAKVGWNLRTENSDKDAEAVGSGVTIDGKPVTVQQLEGLSIAVKSDLFQSLTDYRTMKALAPDMRWGADVVKATEAELLRTPNFGRKSLNKVRLFLQRFDLPMGGEVEGFKPPGG